MRLSKVPDDRCSRAESERLISAIFSSDFIALAFTAGGIDID
jgi:hypothetical protein